jgi:hypothetical protein
MAKEDKGFEIVSMLAILVKIRSVKPIIALSHGIQQPT